MDQSLLYHVLIIYEQKTGKILINIPFGNLNEIQAHYIAMFFSAIQTFVKNIGIDGAKNIEAIDLNNYCFKIYSLQLELLLDIIIIFPKTSSLIPYSLLSLIVNKICLNHYIFREWDGKSHKQFDPIKKSIINEINTYLMKKVEIRIS